MTTFSSSHHLYQRSIHEDKTTSLGILYEKIPPGSRVLDIGTGSGALGAHLASRKNCLVDGITYNADEAALAAPAYRKVLVADLETCNIGDLFAGQCYDIIVCADILEHLRQPQILLEQCRQMLATQGRLLVSVPNVGYSGLLAELFRGDFRYRVEGLLDNTHLRFFTRRSLARLLDECGWQVDEMQAVLLDLPDSEFANVFNELPPAVARYLLTLPDGLAYQFIADTQPVKNRTVITNASRMHTTASRAHFSCLLYIADEHGYAEERKVAAHGAIGEEFQWIGFDLPSLGTPPRGLRLDPADRPGLLRLHEMRLRDGNGEIVWSWDARVKSLKSCPQQQIVFEVPWADFPGGVLLLTGDDPYFELPIPRELLAAHGNGGRLEVAIGWPMSADGSVFARKLRASAAEIERLEGQLSVVQDTASAAARGREHAIILASQAEDALKRMTDTLASQMARASALQQDQHKLLEEHHQLRQHLAEIEASTVFRATRPLVRLKMRFDRTLRTSRARRNEERTTPKPVTPNGNPVDIIVPVYRGLGDTQCCIESVLASHQETPFRLVVINDASPEPELTAWLRTLEARDARVTLLENDVNLGFVSTVNRGMQLAPDRDVVLLNSDAEVANDWLDRLQRSAYQAPRTGSVTPFSNNATICSYPRFCEANPLPAGTDTATLDSIFSVTNAGQTVEIPTGVGFCMYIRRDCLTETGYFDVERFGRGYGEENDFCMRALNLGWHHVLALDTFVRHAGGVSFGEHKSPREREAQAVLQRLHPSYEAKVHSHIAEDPALPARLAVDLARIKATGLPVVLFVTHDRAGGTRRHTLELTEELKGLATILTLRPDAGGNTVLERAEPAESFALAFRLPQEFTALLHALEAVGVAHVHYHHLLGHAPETFGLARRLGVTHDFTVHDYYSICPQITLTDRSNGYCGERGLEQCTACLQHSAAPGGVSIVEWRNGYHPLLATARHIFTPSADAAARMARMVPAERIIALPHTDLTGKPLPEPSPAPLAAGASLKVAVIGALSPIKGADILEAAALDAASKNIPVEFHLLGYAYRSLLTQPQARLTVHGEYCEEDLPALLAWLKPDLIWFPALWPETYSYTLSACLEAGLPIVAPNLGAFPERLARRPWTWIHPWDTPATDWVNLFDTLRQTHFQAASPPPACETPRPAYSPFSYHADYLFGIVPRPHGAPLDAIFLRRHQPGREDSQGVRHRIKRTTLNTLVRLRSAPILRGLARRIPLRWQTRVKTRLRS